MPAPSPRELWRWFGAYLFVAVCFVLGAAMARFAWWLFRDQPLPALVLVAIGCAGIGHAVSRFMLSRRE